jgi:D-threo-aldose 1-dehydrogenase
MERRELGSTGVEVTRLALGTGPLGGLYRAVGDENARATVDAAWERGVRAFDTAPHYGAGLAERRLGAALRGRPRDEYVLSTKVGRLLVPGPDDAGEPYVESTGLRRTWDFSADGVRRSLEASLERLGLDRVDVALVHDPEHHLEQAIGEALPALARLRDQGVVRAIGAGMNYTAPLARIVRESDADCVLAAGRYTLLDRSAADDLLPLCAERGVAVLAAGAFNSGILADPGPDATYDYAPAPPELLERARALAALCERHGVPLPTAAMRFPLRHPTVSCLLVGARTAAEIHADVDALERPLPDALWEELG